MDQDEGIVRMEIPELEEFIKSTVVRLTEESEVVEKLDDYDRLLKEATDMRKKIEALEAEVKAQAKALAAQPQTTMKAEGESEDDEDEDEGKKKKFEFPPKKDEKKKDDEEDEEEKPAEKSEAEVKVDALEKELKELKESPLYKAQQDVEIEDAKTAPAPSLLGSIVDAHYGGN
jgi:hypothetical protein